MNYGIIPVTSDAVFEWLGPASALRRTLEKLAGVRELDQIVLAMPESHERLALVKRETASLRGIESLIVTVPRVDLSLLDLAQQLVRGDLSDAKHLLLLNPLFPLISVETVERSMQAALHLDYRAAISVLHGLRPVVQVARLGYELQQGPVYVDACMAVKRDVLDRVVPLTTLPISLTQIEAIDVGTEEGFKLANSLFLGFI